MLLNYLFRNEKARQEKIEKRYILYVIIMIALFCREDEHRRFCSLKLWSYNYRAFKHLK